MKTPIDINVETETTSKYRLTLTKGQLIDLLNLYFEVHPLKLGDKERIKIPNHAFLTVEGVEDLFSDEVHLEWENRS